MKNKAPYFDDKGRFHHPCCIPDCRRHGTFGIGVFLLQGKLGRWFCAPHYRQEIHKEKIVERSITPPPIEKQGRLF